MTDTGDRTGLSNIHGSAPKHDSPPFNPDEIAAQIAVLSELTSQPPFLDMLREIEAAPPAQRLSKATELATVDGLRSRGLDLPEDFRITTRYFEDPSNPLRADVAIDGPPPVAGLMKDKPWTICASGGFFVCVTVGREA